MRFKVNYYFTDSHNHFADYFCERDLKPGTKCYAACMEAKKKGFAISPIDEYGDYAVVTVMKWWQLF
jgi:hypothetical protein